MARSPTPKRYAQAVFQIAEEQGNIDQWVNDLEETLALIKNEKFRLYLEMPRISLAKKVRAIEESLVNINPLARNVVALLISRDTLALYPLIVLQYQNFVDNHYGRKRAVVTTAITLEDDLQSKIRTQLSDLLGTDVVLSTRTEPKVLGGMTIRVGDKLIDGSIRGKFSELRNDLLKSLG
jgi:F-type H+-transporting ATPase subunit delta